MRKCLLGSLLLSLLLLSWFFWEVGIGVETLAAVPNTPKQLSLLTPVPTATMSTTPPASLDSTSGTASNLATRPSCLNFMAIPRNAEDAIKQVWKQGDQWLNCTHYDKSPLHRNSQRFCKTPDFPVEGGEYGSYCSKRHMPPALDHTLAGSYDNTCDTFCVVRDPLQRILSLFQNLKPKAACDAKALRLFIDDEFRTARLLRYDKDCHFLPQADFIFSHNGTRYCQHVLRYENVTSEFNALMARFQLSARLDKFVGDERAKCKLQLPEDLLPLVWSHYASDFELFGYAAPPKMSESLSALAPDRGKCLSFVHIPKTGGSSIEDTISGDTLGAPYWGHTPWKGRLWGRKDDRLHCSAGVEQKGCASGPRCCRFKELAGPSNFPLCSTWHVPPNYDPVLLQSYREDDCETFCVVRHPLQRWISQFNFQPGSKDYCHEAGAIKYFETHFAKYNTSKLLDDCHFLPQVDYVFGRTPGSRENGPRTCQHVLHFENVTHEFDALMRRFDYPFRLRAHTHPLGVFRTCKLNLPGRVEAQLRQTYADDFEAFGYA